MMKKKLMRHKIFRPQVSGILFILLLAIAALSVSAQAADVPGTVSEQGPPWSDRIDTGGPAFQAAYSFDYGDPTAAEQAHLEAINRARLDPYGEAARLGIDLFEGVPSGAISGNPVQPLVMNKNILAAARAHSQDMIDNDFFSHYSQDGSSPFDRMSAQGYSYAYAGENIAIIYASYEIGDVQAALNNHDNLFIDENYPDRGHRVNILSENFKEIGVGTGFGEYSGLPYGYTVTCDFGSSSLYSGSFILGVVYDDADGDSYYDAGEGLSNVAIQVSGSDSGSTATATAGGYGIPVNDGSYTVTATLSDGTVAVKSVVISSENQKVDFLKSEFGTGSGGSTATTLGESAGIHTYSVAAADPLSLKVNVTNSANAAPVYEWIWVTMTVGGIQTPLYALTASGWQVIDLTSSFETLSYDHGAATTFSLGDFSMADIGLGSGDTLIYGYAYTPTAAISGLVVENMVTIQVN